MLERILVPLDGSSASEIVLPYVAEITAKTGAETILVRVCGSEATNLVHIYRSYLDHVKEKAKHELERYGPKETAGLRCAVLLGKPATEILRYADENRVDLMVMASRGSSGTGPWLLGNIAAKVLRAAARPILLIRRPAGQTALAREKLLQKILLPLDGSQPGEAAIPLAKEMAQAIGAELILFQVVEAPMTTWAGPSVNMTYEALQDYRERRKPLALSYITRIAKPLQASGVLTSTDVAFGYTADEIISYAERNHFDLIAMSTHGWSGIGRWVFGSVTDKVLHAGDIAVMTVPPSLPSLV